MTRAGKKITGTLLKKFVSRKKIQDDVVESVKNFDFKRDIPGVTQPGTAKKSRAKAGLNRLARKVSAQPQQKNRLRKTVIRAGLIILLVFLGGVGVKYSGIGQVIGAGFAEIEYFHLKNLDISGCRVTDKGSVRKLAGLDYNTSLLTLEKEAVSSRIAQNPWIASARVTVKWPDGLEIIVREHKPEAIIALGETGHKSLYYVSNRGLPFTRVSLDDELDYPVITGLSSMEELEEDIETRKDVFTFLKQAKRNNPRLPIQGVSEIHINDQKELVIYMVDHPFPIYMGKGEMKSKYRQLLSVLEVLYRKHSKGAKISKVASIRMDYYGDKALVSLDE